MKNATNKIERCEKQFQKKNNVKTATALILRYWLYYMTTGDQNGIYKAYHQIKASLNHNRSSVELCLCSILIHIQMENWHKAKETIDTLYSYRNYLKNNQPVAYGWLLYFQGRYELYNNRMRQANQHYKALSDYAAGQKDAIFLLQRGSLQWEIARKTGSGSQEALLRLEHYYLKGGRSILLFQQLYDFFRLLVPIQHKSPLLMPFVYWGLANSINLREILDFYHDHIVFSLSRSFSMCAKIYSVYPQEWLLKEIVNRLMEAEDYSKEAYGYYRQAEKKQLELPRLYHFLVCSAHKYQIEEVSRHTLNQFLLAGEIDNDLKAFVYHILLTQKKFRDLAKKHVKGMVTFALSCLDDNTTGRYLNSLYKFILTDCRIIEVPAVYTHKIEEILKNELFCYDVKAESPAVRQLWLIEKEKKEMAEYKLENGEAKVKAVNEFFSYVCFGEGTKHIFDEECAVVKRIENADIDLYLYFYRQGLITIEIAIALAKYYMALEKTTEKLSEDDFAQILSYILQQPMVSHRYKMQIRALLGNLHLNRDRYEEALECYLGVDENYLNDKYITKMLDVFLTNNKYEKAAELINKKPHCIPEKKLYHAVKQIAEAEKCHDKLASVAFSLILKSWYDKLLLDIVLRYYKGSIAEWQELSKLLTSVSASNEALDEIILKNSIWMHHFDEGSQKVFVRMFEQYPHNPFVDMFARYCIYEIVINSEKPLYETVETLERLALKNEDDRLLTYGLGCLYLGQSFLTIESENILNRIPSLLMDDDLLLPIFKEKKDKLGSSLYIEKNQAFLYRSTPNKNVYLYYRIDSSTEYKKVPMQYFHFGIYLAKLTHFYGERIRYYFGEEMETGSIASQEETIDNTSVFVDENATDPYFHINNGLVYAQMFKYEQAEANISKSLQNTKSIKGKIL